MKLRVGLVGLGDDWQSCHCPALRALTDRFEVRAVCTHVAARAEQAAREFGAATVDGFRALAARSDVDAVLLLSPEWYGALPILAACDSGKAVYCAAPLDIDLTAARQMKLRIEQSGVAFMAEFPRRNAPATLRLKELIATRLGEPRLVFCHVRKPQSPPSECDDLQSSAIRDMMELVDWCRYVIAGEPTTVNGVQHLTPPDEQRRRDYQMLSLDFSAADQPGSGALAHISSGEYLRHDWPKAASFRPPAELQVCCERGVAFLDLPSTLIWFDDAGRHHESLESERPVGEQLLTQFHRAVTSLVRKTGDLEDAYRAMRVMLRADQSWKDGRRLSIDFA
ncbi:MAG: Gfo/Idh/MocA family oxidoreductase [Pirellulaceae bacterium]|jgi:predicted dehydrogenase|nr:Gfo/Idh/MocA family oxidoreductase [Pirellulaceae bacterium]MDP7015725.1 Gfo/Idh/MocA family oxidoreductase [Pirellulaceae bacterium]